MIFPICKAIRTINSMMANLAYKGFTEIKGKLLIPIKKPKEIELFDEGKRITKEIS